MFLKSHGIYLKTITLEEYEDTRANIDFMIFFIQNASILQTIKLKFRLHKDFTVKFYKQQEKMLQMHKRASKCARLELTTSCEHMHLDLANTRVECLELSNPFICEC